MSLNFDEYLLAGKSFHYPAFAVFFIRGSTRFHTKKLFLYNNTEIREKNLQVLGASRRGLLRVVRITLEKANQPLLKYFQKIILNKQQLILWKKKVEREQTVSE